MSDDACWWQTFFDGAWGRLQMRGYPAKRTAGEVDLIVEALRLKPGQRILDLPCGAGRHTIELTRRGFPATGLDLNPAAVQKAVSDASAADLEVEFVQGDMRALPWVEEFDAAVCFFGSFGYFSDPDNLSFAESVARTLKTNGRFLIETHVMESLFPIFREKDWGTAGPDFDSAKILEQRRWDAEARRVETKWTFIGPEGIETGESSIRIYSYGELCGLLRDAGFRTFEGIDSQTREPFGIRSRRLAIVAGL